MIVNAPEPAKCVVVISKFIIVCKKCLNFHDYNTNTKQN